MNYSVPLLRKARKMKIMEALIAIAVITGSLLIAYAIVLILINRKLK